MLQQRHGQSGSRTYESWLKMMKRCHDETSDQYQWYGGRGIKVQESWNKFSGFLADMGQRPPGKSLDRTNNNKDYSKDNCRWSTPKEQSFNRRSTTIIKIGERKETCLTYLGKEFGFSASLVQKRLRSGVDKERIFRGTPLEGQKFIIIHFSSRIDMGGMHVPY